MRIIMMSLFTALMLICSPHVSTAAAVKTYVAEFNVVGAPNKDELKSTLQSLLTSRLNLNRIRLVDKPEKAELQLFGNYAVFGKVFSIDVLIKNSLTDSMTKVFEQGASQDDLIPAFSRLAEKLDREIAIALPVTAPVVSVKPVTPVPVAATITAPVVMPKIDAPPAKAEENYVVKSETPNQNTPGFWSSDPLTGVHTAIALGRTLPTGEREIFIAGANTIRYFKKGSELRQVAEISIPVYAKVLTIDTADLDRDGIPELYVSIIDRKSVSSKIYKPSDVGMELIADNQPWLYRGIGNDYKARTIFAQSVSSKGEYASEIFELTKSGQRFETTKTRTLPKHGNIFNFTRFSDTKGVEKIAVLDEDGYIILYSVNGNELWKSSDKFGGSETYFNYESVAQLRNKGVTSRWNFLEQRIVALPDGTLIVPRNDGTFSIGNNRSYNKHLIFGLQWSGALLKESWHTRVTPSYLADYAYDSATQEFLLLEVIQKVGLFNTGKTIISINKMQ